MTFYAKSILFDIKRAAQEERMDYLRTDFPKYIQTIIQQLKKEFEAYNEAVGLVCEVAKVSQ